MKHLPHILVILMVLFAPAFAIRAQDAPAGKVEIQEPDKVSILLEKHKAICKLYPEVDGFRVQIYFDSGIHSRRGAYDVYKRFITAHPEHEAYVTYQEPNYKVRVGDFRTRIEAEGFLRSILSEYPSAFVIKDLILFPPLPDVSTTSNEQSQ